MGQGPVARFPVAEKQRRYGATTLTSRTLSEICKEKRNRRVGTFRRTVLALMSDDRPALGRDPTDRARALPYP